MHGTQGKDGKGIKHFSLKLWREKATQITMTLMGG